MANASTTHNGWARVLDSSTSRLAVWSNGYKRLEIGDLALTQGGANTAALLHGLGTSTTRAKTETANKNFLGYWVESAATSGDARGIYMRLYISGAGGSGEAGRFYTTVSAAASSSGTVNGIHSSLSVTTGGTTPGAGNALRATLDVGASITPTGTLACIQADSNFGSSAVLGATTAFFHLDNVGTAPTTNGIPLLFNILNANTSTFFVTATNTTIDHALKISIDGTAYWIGLYDAVTGS